MINKDVKMKGLRANHMATQMSQMKHIRGLMLIFISGLFAMGCQPSQPPESPEARMIPAPGLYPAEQQVTIELPSTAENVYLTTDTSEPEPNALCAYSGESITVDRPTQIKIRYDFKGQTYLREGLYIVEEVVEDHRYTNRKVVETWENFFLRHVIRAMSPPDNVDSTLTLRDGEGGVVTLETRILGRTPFTKIPNKGSQAYRFNFFKHIDADTGEEVMIRSGTVYGYRSEDGGYYGASENKGERLYFSGTYTGWAEGEFQINENGDVYAGRYTVMCINRGCSSDPVIYELAANKELIEVGPARHDDSWSCSEPETLEGGSEALPE
jgi:hypothetical protein